MERKEKYMSKNNLEIITLKKENITDFAKERNNLLKESKADWVMFLDSDETLSKELEKEITNLKLENSNFSGFYVKRKIYFCGQYVGVDKALRLGRQGTGKWARAVHETWEIKGKVGNLKNYIIHNTATNLHDYIDKINNYSDIHARENYKEGKRSNIFKIMFYPKMKFLENIFKGRGFVFSLMQALHSFLGWTKLWELQKD
jgi:glycosyltransferase involved in cell wall biosynthesis